MKVQIKIFVSLLTKIKATKHTMYTTIPLVFIIIYFLVNIAKGYAVNMNSSDYRIEAGNVNIGGKPQSSSSYNLSTTMGQTAAGQFSSTGYIVKAGFQYIHSIIPFAFSISNISINLGTLAAQTPSTDTTQLTVSFGSSGQYQVTVEEIGTLSTFGGANSIPDTTCDGGAETCTETSSAVWSSNSAYGFGYNMSGNDIPTDFLDSTYYRPFPDRTLSESPAVVMSNQNVGENRQATVTIKANISPLQEAGTYTTVINFIATPSY